MSKTPYEIRLDLLHLAQSILTEQNMNKRIQLENDWNMECERVRIGVERAGTSPVFQKFPEVPQFNEDQVIAISEKLNAFVSNNT